MILILRHVLLPTTERGGDALRLNYTMMSAGMFSDLRTLSLKYPLQIRLLHSLATPLQALETTVFDISSTASWSRALNGMMLSAVSSFFFYKSRTTMSEKFGVGSMH